MKCQKKFWNEISKKVLKWNDTKMFWNEMTKKVLKRNDMTWNEFWNENDFLEMTFKTRKFWNEMT